MQFKGEFADPWGSESRSCRLIFIGRHLDREMLTRGFEACRDIHEYILEANVTSTTLRFAVGDTVICRTAPEDYSLGVIAAVFHREPQFPPGHFVPYQVKLQSGGYVYVPADRDLYVRTETFGQRRSDRDVSAPVVGGQALAGPL